jgi:hypothetical protein
MPKGAIKRRIDERPALDIGGTPAAATVSTAPPAPPLLPAPVLTSITTAIYQSAQTPAAKVDLTWTYETTVAVTGYLVQWSTDSTFATNTNGMPANGANLSASIFPLPASILYYFRVAAIVGAAGVQSPWSTAASITTAADTTVPSAPSGQAGAFIGTGDFSVTFTPSTSANVKWHEVRIWESASKVTLYTTRYTTTGRVIWTAGENVASVAAGDPSLYAEVRAESWGGIFSSAVNTGLITKAAPTQPTITQSWSGDAGTAGPDLTFTWPAISDAAYYNIALNGQTARRVSATVYTYTLERNRGDNGSADPTITYSITAVDGLGQSSTAASGTATNAAPTTPTATLTQGAVSGLYASVTSAPVADFWRYEFVFKRDGSTVATVFSAGSNQRYEMQGAGDDGFHSWTVVIRQEDQFGQFSGTFTPSAVAFEALTLSYLRDQVVYSDSIATAPSTLKTELANAVTQSGGVSYAA